MRMWAAPPMVMCNKHLLGEHLEMHMYVGSINRGTNMKGFIDKNLLDTSLIKIRHDSLVHEMGIRKMNHNSPLYYIDQLFQGIGSVKEIDSIKELARRCKDCRHRIILYGHYNPKTLPPLAS